MSVSESGYRFGGNGVKRLGNLLTFACVVYLIYLGFHFEEHFQLEQLQHTFSASGFAMGTMIWVLVNVTLASAWSLLLWANKIPSNWKLDFKIVLSTQIAKYLPGNVFHYAGRMVHYKTNGLQFSSSGKLLIHEIALVASTALVIGLLATFLPMLLSFAVLGMAVAAWMVPVIFGGRIWKERRLEYPSRRLLGGYLLATFCYAIGFGLSATIYLLVLENVNRTEMLPLLGASTLSWVAGFLTPGSPGGVGVREVVFTSIADFAPHPSLLLAVVHLRICSLFGDGVCALLAALIRTRS